MTVGAMSECRAVLFDLDGTLVDSTYFHTLAWWQAFRRFDLDVPLSRVHRAIGMGADQLVPHVVDGELPDGVAVDDVAASHDAVYATWWPALRPAPGARDLVRRCHRAGKVTVLASSSGSRELQVVRELLDVDDALDHITSAEDAELSKPAPDLIGVALRRSGVDADQAVLIGDAVWDVHAAADAGVACIGLECGGTSAAELRAAGAIAVYRDAADLLMQWIMAGEGPPS